ncbi:TetR/AcrR family transcriptional regulator [Sporolactobacillus pectinivorans]|uniref:TetR/AcrR family transcriptional regulator n=1 Tax=Sporolactobacillus pectinivorans TaxID=1591408 RepID=UPI000C255D5A|nr:TetR/AcrR family transcriptional regulator [Sporolactobacillus pectinivorans]
MNENDRRFKRTEQIIRDVFVQLVNERGFNHVTIKDITERANLNRATFYLHYTDKYELMTAFQKKFLEDAKNLSTESKKIDIFSLYDKEETILFLVKILQYYKDHSSVIKMMLNENRSDFIKLMKQLVFQNLFEIPAVKEQGSQLSIPKNYLISYIFSAHFGILQEWLDTGMKENPEEIAGIMSKMTVQGTIAASGILTGYGKKA